MMEGKMSGVPSTVNTLTPQNMSVMSPSTQPATYTTVGSVYNPQANTPIQPPARRGRNPRLTYNSPAGLSLLANLSTQDPYSPPTTATSLQQYAPLQQNYDRAVNPSTSNTENPRLSSSRHAARGSIDITTHTMAPPPGFSGPSGWPSLAESSTEAGRDNKDVGNEDEDDGVYDIAAENMFKQLGVKAITNLASYENPMQKAAQKKLARARAPLTMTAANVPRAPIPLYGAHNTPSLRQDVRVTPELLRAARTDPSVLTGVDMGKHGPDRTDLMRNHPDLLSFPHYQRSESSQSEAKQPTKQLPTGPSSAYSALATGPGAPRPLTAGPPGQRRHDTSNFENCIKRLQSVPVQDVPDKTARSTGQDLKLESTFNAAVRHGRPPSAIPSRTLSPYETRSLASQQPIGGELVVHQSTYQHEELPSVRIQGIRDTLPVEAAKKYFPHGFPASYNRHNVEPISSNWTEKYPLHDRRDWRRTPDEIRHHNAKVNASFYNGNPLLGKTMDAASREAQRRNLDRQLGVSDEERERALNRDLQIAHTFNISGSRRAVYPHLSVEEVNHQDTSEAAEPLLSMAFATLLSYQEDDGEKKTMSGWDLDPAPFYIDRNSRGRGSLFGAAPAKGKSLRPRTN